MTEQTSGTGVATRAEQGKEASLGGSSIDWARVLKDPTAFPEIDRDTTDRVRSIIEADAQVVRASFGKGMDDSTFAAVAHTGVENIREAHAKLTMLWGAISLSEPISGAKQSDRVKAMRKLCEDSGVNGKMISVMIKIAPAMIWGVLPASEAGWKAGREIYQNGLSDQLDALVRTARMAPAEVGTEREDGTVVTEADHKRAVKALAAKQDGLADQALALLADAKRKRDESRGATVSAAPAVEAPAPEGEEASPEGSEEETAPEGEAPAEALGTPRADNGGDADAAWDALLKSVHAHAARYCGHLTAPKDIRAMTDALDEAFRDGVQHGQSVAGK